MSIGRLDRRITVLVYAPTRDAASGEEVPAWTTLATVSAEVLPVGGREAYQAQQMVARRMNRFRIRWMSGFDEKARIDYDGLVWNIRNIAEIGRRRGLEILAEVINP